MWIKQMQVAGAAVWVASTQPCTANSSLGAPAADWLEGVWPKFSQDMVKSTGAAGHAICECVSYIRTRYVHAEACI
jgi:hypothetical protein